MQQNHNKSSHIFNKKLLKKLDKFGKKCYRFAALK